MHHSPHRTAAFAFTAGMLTLAACAPVSTAPSDFTLSPASAAIVEREIVVTIPIDARVQEVADGIVEDHGVELVAEWPISTLEVHCFVFRVATGEPVETLIEAIAADDRVVAAQPMQSFEVLGDPYDDRLVTLQHGPSSLDAFRAHQLATGKSVSVALIDTGVDAGHPDLEGRIAANRDFIGDGGDGTNEIHGTALAGVIGAVPNNGIGIVGIAPEATITSLRGCWQITNARTGRCTSFTLARALNVAVTQGFDVINMSLQGPYDPLLAEIIEVGLAQGQTFVAAYSLDEEGDFPALAEGVIAVATDAPNAAPEAVRAPGIDIITTVPGARYDFLSGSSLASAHVAGIAALLLEHRKSMTGAEIRAVLQQSTGAEGNAVDACLAVQSIIGGEGCV